LSTAVKRREKRKTRTTMHKEKKNEKEMEIKKGPKQTKRHGLGDGVENTLISSGTSNSSRKGPRGRMGEKELPSVEKGN